MNDCAKCVDAADIPLCVDLDGTLTPVDTLDESLLALARNTPAALPLLPLWLRRGKAGFKQALADRVRLDVASLPLRPELMEWLQAEHAAGRRLVLVTAANRQIADDVAERVGVFDEVLASDAHTNLAGENKRAALVARFGERGFDYVGNATPDRKVWRSAHQAIVVGGPALAARAQEVAELGRVFAPPPASLKTWVKAARLYQWVKNALVLLPALLAHAIFQPGVVEHALLAFLAFGLCASSVYIVNDLFDLPSDRRHPRKCNRPFAAGALSARSGAVAALLLLASAVAIAVSVNAQFCAVLAIYYVCTWAYSLRLKRIALLDVMTLAGLYTVRIIAGAAATGIELSFWLLAFSVFIFLSLGIVKRFAELDGGRASGKSSGHGRGYGPEDLSVLMSLGTSAGYSAVVVMALYINSGDSQLLYRHHKPLWLMCPLMLFWISRVWMMTTRGQMHDDPIVFALRDKVSLAIVAAIVLVVALSV
jgi:4-hydroxybenzoate polyprenyltransferase/phosphoserine phosphatase